MYLSPSTKLLCPASGALLKRESSMKRPWPPYQYHQYLPVGHWPRSCLLGPREVVCQQPLHVFRQDAGSYDLP